MFRIVYSIAFFSIAAIVSGQPTFSSDVAPIIFNHCTTCHRAGEIGPMSLTNYDEVKNWAGTIKYVTSSKIMPPWKADQTYSRFLDENFLSDDQIKTIADWGGRLNSLPVNLFLRTDDIDLISKINQETNLQQPEDCFAWLRSKKDNFR